MKEMKIVLSERRRNLVDDILKEFSINPRIFVSEASSGSTKDKEVQWSFYIKEGYTNSFIERLKSVGVGSTYGVVSMVPVEFYISSEDTPITGEKSLGVNLEEIIFSLQDSYFGIMYVTLAILSGILAGYGIANKSQVILIGSMIVAPLLGPIALTSVGLLTPRRGILFKGILTEVAGLIVTIGTGIIVGFSIMAINLSVEGDPMGSNTSQLIMDACNNAEILTRTQLNYATLVLAIFSGLAAGIIISKGMSVNIVGVAIAASICPPATNIGLNISVLLLYIYKPSLLATSSVTNFYVPVILSTAFLVLNIFLINISITIVLWVLGVASKSGITRRRKSSVIKANIMWITLLLLFVSILFLLFSPFSIGLTPVTHYCPGP